MLGADGCRCELQECRSATPQRHPTSEVTGLLAISSSAGRDQVISATPLMREAHAGVLHVLDSGYFQFGCLGSRPGCFRGVGVVSPRSRREIDRPICRERTKSSSATVADRDRWNCLGPGVARGRCNHARGSGRGASRTSDRFPYVNGFEGRWPCRLPGRRSSADFLRRHVAGAEHDPADRAV